MPKSLLQHFMRLNNFYVVSLLFIITLLCYINTFGNGLFFDDEHFIYNNQAVKSFDINNLFEKSLVSGGGKLSNYYRPLLFSGFSIEYQLSKDNGFIYHFDSFIIHTAGGIVLFLLLLKLFKNKPLAFLTALLFLIHPVQTEAVAYASGRGDPLSFLFIMLSLHTSMTKKMKITILSLACFIFALLSKEIALMTPGLIFLVSLFSQSKLSKNAIKKSLIRTLPYAVLAGGYFLLRLTILNFDNTLNFYKTTTIYSRSLFVRLSTFFNLLPTYIGLVGFPKNLFMERDEEIRIITSPTFSAVLSVLGLIAGAILGVIKRQTSPVILFSFLWIGITFVPTSGIIPINGIFYEHFLYFPSVGFFLLFSFIFLWLYHRTSQKIKYGLDFLLIMIIFLLCVRTIARNQEWHDPITFYNQTLFHVQSPRAYNNLAMVYAENGDNKNAIANYKNAIKLQDTYPEAHYNLGNSYLALNDAKNAEAEYKAALKIDPYFYLAYIKLFILYKSANDQVGIGFVETQLLQLGKYNSQFLNLLDQLKKAP